MAHVDLRAPAQEFLKGVPVSQDIMAPGAQVHVN